MEEGRKEEGTQVSDGIASEELRDRLGDYLNRVEYGREEFPIKRRGKVIARLVPVESAA